MNLVKVLILGSTGFVGKNISECISGSITTIQTTRRDQRENNEHEIYFDLFDDSSWKNIINVSPDVIINAAAYGVVKLQTDNDIMRKVNFTLIKKLFEYIQESDCHPYWLQIGTAFEYDLSKQHITEESPCLPETSYGSSKLEMSNYLIQNAKPGTYSIIRPFGMFGKYEDSSKFFPLLINAQKMNSAIELSPGTQKRDYIYVGDLGAFINKQLIKKMISRLPKVLNLGSGNALSFLEYASTLKNVLPNFNPHLWQWGKKEFRAGEPALFYSASKKAREYGFTTTRLEDGFLETAKYYLSN